ncbi:phosphoesterase PA-phosphatase [Paenibacillus pectinilyticus]|uniref:Phosphoesterase PA-phosphatase n=1 Tax=Paenibacillus pectinilyticus TaxID=512399 RepID=A0A1C1A1J7_9BACL|nr:phosphatase PAP2 family protein [Paenibacillus pectinilyticus]OCT14384.1 phosphoesterase PA-phosphatase [Paenibacillus pectinilyticus]
MHSKLKVTIFLVLSVISVLCFLVVASLLKGQPIAHFDSSVIASIQGMERPWLTSLMKAFTFIGSTPVVIVIAIGCLFLFFKFLHHRLELVLFLVLVAGTAILNFILKMIFQRERPSLHRIIQETGYSFPSGHSMEAFALYAALAFLLWRHVPTKRGRTTVILISILMILMIGISRIYLGVHYPSDVVGAYFASGFWFTFSVWIFQWYMENRAKRVRSIER